MSASEAMGRGGAAARASEHTLVRAYGGSAFAPADALTRATRARPSVQQARPAPPVPPSEPWHLAEAEADAQRTPRSAGPVTKRSASPTVPVWDRFVRVFHWTLVAAFFGAYFNTEHIGLVHKGCGYLCVCLVLARGVWGFFGSRHARFASFLPGPGKLARYLAAVLRGREPRHLSHNPAGSVMVIYLLLAVAGIGISGWMMELDAFWGNELVETVHTVLVDATLVAIALHVLANFYASWHHRENLVASMLHGRKRRLERPPPGR